MLNFSGRRIFSGERCQQTGRVCRGHQKPLLCLCAKGREDVDCQVHSLAFRSQPAAGNFLLNLCPDVYLVSQDGMTAGMLGATISIFRIDHLLLPQSSSDHFYGYFYLTDTCVKITTADTFPYFTKLEQVL